jgi:hypothetical protein
MLLPLVIFSCNTFDKFDHFGIGNTFKKSFTVNIDPNNNLSFAKSVEFAASDDEVIENNIDNINKFKVTQISLSIEKYIGNNEAKANGYVRFQSGGKNIGDSVKIENLNFKQLFDSKKRLVLPLTEATYSAIKNAYLTNETIIITSNGAVDSVTEILEIEFGIFMTIEATISKE